ncbi:MAG TPA: isovaleryl-CoA dehydrogenase [Burkholderiaceae bacterium]|nr:isovaleryl-CoA dehydrogenase [Burkholderiaceae bacterium]
MSEPIHAGWDTHRVENQPAPLRDRNLWRDDAPLREALARTPAGWAVPWLDALGAELGAGEWIDRAELANRHPPELRSFDRAGRRLDRVDFHPAYHELMGLAIRHGLHASPWDETRPGGHVARAAAYLMFGQLENGVQCPVTMTYAVVPALRRHPALWATLGPLLRSREYDPRFVPLSQKRGITMGMGMTEKQGGSDVRTNSSVARRDADGAWRLTGHKWFFSAPMCDAFLVLAQAPGGLTCFFLPRFAPDGSPNRIRIQRLKDKVGNRSNASSEVEFMDAWAEPVGDEGRGIPTILEMGTMTRLDCAIGASGILRHAVAQAVHHARQRRAFGATLVEQPLMRTVLADLALESEAATALSMRLAAAYDSDAPEEVELRRVLTPAAKYWICKRLPAAAAEAMEVAGGIGYVEEAPFARLFRESPLNSIWEGSGNVMALDVLRALGRTSGTVPALLAEIGRARGADRRFDAAHDRLAAMLEPPADHELAQAQARATTAAIATTMQASLLLRHAPPEVADAFCASRLGGAEGAGEATGGGTFGLLRAGRPALEAIVARALPA